jgi:hypothetical protein
MQQTQTNGGQSCWTTSVFFTLVPRPTGYDVGLSTWQRVHTCDTHTIMVVQVSVQLNN